MPPAEDADSLGGRSEGDLGGASPHPPCQTMTTRFALHTWTLDTTPFSDVLRIARETGWQAIELRRVDFSRAAAAGRPAESVLDEVKASGLPVACVGVELGWMTAAGDERRRLLGVFDESCRWARSLGSSTVMSPVDKG